MLKSILTAALRNIVRHQSFSLINMLGLSLSMSLGLLIILVVKEQYTYDNFHRDAERIYRVNTRALRVEGGSEPYASAPLPIGTTLRDEYSFTENVVRINRRLRADAVYGDRNVPVSGLIVDPSFLHVFNFRLRQGDLQTALLRPDGLVLTEQAAKKLFGDSDALGRPVTLKGYGEFTVAGILEPIPGKTHFEFEVLASMTLMPSLEHQGKLSPSINNWNNYYGNYVYFKVREGTQISEVEEALQAIYRKYYSDLTLEIRDRGYEFYLQPLESITPGPQLSNQMGKGMPDMVIYFMGGLALVVMVMAVFNYTNLMIAKSLSRAREIGVRKVVGARRFQVFFQFMGESVVFAIVSLAFSYLLLQVLKPAFMQLNIAREFSPDLTEDYSVGLYFLLFAVAVGCIGGLLPATYLSSFSAMKVLKTRDTLKLQTRLTLRKALIVTQFTLSVALIITVLVIYRQVDFMVSKDYGINEKDIMNIRLQGMQYATLAREVSNLPGVISVGGVSHALGTWADRASEYKKTYEEPPFNMRDFIVNSTYIKNLGLTFVAGGNFPEGYAGDPEKYVILNERALDLFRFPDAASAVGQLVYVEDSLTLRIVGVVKDFHFRPLSYQIGPLALRCNESGLGFASARILPSEKARVAAALEILWKKLDPVHPLQWNMMEDEIDEAYTQAGFRDTLKIVGYISFLAIVIACLGISGMAMYATQTRIKEIGIRKVMGASSQQVTFLLSRTFIFMIVIAAILGVPAGYYFGEMFLTTYAYKIQITPLLILTGVAVVGISGVLMVASQTWRAAAANPVESLRYE